MKAILELEMPESCIDCPFVDIPWGYHKIPGVAVIPVKDTYVSCKITGETAYRSRCMEDDENYCNYKETRASFCPLKIMPDVPLITKVNENRCF